MAGSHASLRAVLALLVSTLLAVGLFPGPAAARPPQRTLSVLSYNIHHGVGGDGRLDLDRIAAVIRDSGADVAALQEVDRHWSARSGFADQAKELARRLRMHHAYGANLDRAPAEPGQPRRQYGTGTPAAGRGDRDVYARDAVPSTAPVLPGLDSPARAAGRTAGCGHRGPRPAVLGVGRGVVCIRVVGGR